MIRDNRDNAFTIDASMDDQQLLEQIVMFYHDRLTQHAPALDFLQQHDLADPAMIERHQLGFADRALSRALPRGNSQAARQIRQRLTQLGILRESGHGHFNGCVVVPIRDEHGAIIDIRGRKIGRKLKSGTPRDMQLPRHGESSTSANGDAIEDETLARLVEQLAGKKSVDVAAANNERVAGLAKSSGSLAQPPAVSATSATADGNSSAAPSTSDDFDIEQNDTEVTVRLDDRHWRVRGLDKNLSYERLKVNLMVSRDEGVHVDTFDLYSSRHRNGFIKAAAAELYVDEAIIKQDFGKILRKLEELQDQQIKATLTASEPPVPELTDAERSEALGLLQDRNLVGRILKDFDRCGLVGETTNKLLCYLACVSRKLDQPLAVLIQSSSAAGKTTLMDATLAFMPEEEQIKYSAMTGQSLYYMGTQNLKHKILAIAEEEGVAQASYALKLLQSEGRLTIASAEKESSGRQQTQTYEVEGPVMMFLTTTSEHPDAELANRCFVVRVNEQVDQTAAIHARQRARYTLAGRSAAADRAAIRTLHQNAQRLLESLTVVIPWADQLTFRADQTRMRRDNAKYLSLIASITLLHQHQRTRKTDKDGGPYIEATVDDIQLANRLASEALGQSLDSLMPQTRQLLVLIDDYVTRCCQELKMDRSDFRFTQRQLRETLGWSDRQLRRHLTRLIELEYVLPYRTGHGNQRQYQLVYDGQGRDGQPFLLGLIDVAQLRKTEYDSRTGGQKRQTGTLPAGIRRPVGKQPAGSKNGATATGNGKLRRSSAARGKNKPQGPRKKRPSRPGGSAT